MDYQEPYKVDHFFPYLEGAFMDNLLHCPVPLQSDRAVLSNFPGDGPPSGAGDSLGSLMDPSVSLLNADHYRAVRLVPQHVQVSVHRSHEVDRHCQQQEGTMDLIWSFHLPDHHLLDLTKVLELASV